MITNVVCPRCSKPLQDTDLNVGTDIGACKACGNFFKVSDALGGTAVPAPFDPERPTPGAWFRQLSDGFETGATTRSVVAFFLVPFMCVWSGFSLGGIYGPQIMKWQLDPFMSVFGVPFVMGSLLFWGVTLMALFGKWTITVHGDEAEMFVGVGSLGRRKRFAWSGVRSVTEGVKPGRNSNTSLIFLEGAIRVQFATGVSEDRLFFLLNTLRGQVR